MPNATLTAGTPTKVKFSVKYNEKEPEPNVVSVRLNAREVCPQKKEAVSISPCPANFKYTNLDKNEKGKWYGELNFDSEFPLHGIWIRVFLDNKGEILAVRSFRIGTDATLIDLFSERFRRSRPAR